VRVEQLQSAFEIDIVYRHFPLHPETPLEGRTLTELFAGRNIDLPAAQARMTQLMAAEGLPYGERTMTYNSRLAQELGKWSDTRTEGTDLHTALFQGYFVEQRNLATIDNLLAIGQQAGFPLPEMQGVLEQRTFQQAVDDDGARAHTLGVTAVPTFVMGQRGLVGAQPYEQLAALAKAAGAVPRHKT